MTMTRGRQVVLSGLLAALAVPAYFAATRHSLSGVAYAAGPGPAAPAAAAEDKAAPKFTGPKKCKLCHTAASTGAQYKVWEKSPHAEAFKVLSSEKALTAGKAKGVEHPDKDPKCLKCHVTGFGEPADRLGDKVPQEEGISCEACHGAGEFYAKKEVFEKGKDEAVKNGLQIPDEKLCRKCHNEESPFYKEFNFEEYKKKIAHPKPKGEGAEKGK
jgi:hypothetical protein